MVHEKERLEGEGESSEEDGEEDEVGDTGIREVEMKDLKVE